MPGLILRGNLKIGDDSATAQDVSTYVTQFELLLTSTDVTVPMTFGDVAQQTRMGPETNTITATYFNDSGASTISGLLIAAYEAKTELYFEGTFQPGAVSATNEVYFGQFVPKTTMVGGTAGALGIATSSWPVNSWGHSAVAVP